MIVMVGGQSRKVGKTTVICRLIEATVEACWTAWKITPHAHAPGSSSDPDTDRFLRAGAIHSELICGNLPAVPPGNLIVESNAAVALLQPDLVVYVRDPAKPDVKASAAAVMARANFIVCASDGCNRELVDAVSRRLVSERQS